ncbi:hypothetical protein K8I61_05430 [bacterium]|nr:hypothetical protein [bacterium]
MTLESALETAEITVGDPAAYRLTVTWDPAISPQDPRLEENLGDLVIRDRKAGKTEKLPDGRMRRTDTFVITSYNVGEHQVPPPLVAFTNAAGEREIAAGEPVTINVRSVAPEDAGQIRDIKPPRALPRDLTRPIISILAAIAALVALAYVIRRILARRRAKSAPAPALSPHEVALARIDAAARLPRSTHDEMKSFYSELADALRDFLDARFFVPAPLLTTSQLRAHLRDAPAAWMPPPDDVLALFDRADFVKFAKFDPDEADIDADIAGARRFVAAATPRPAPADETAKETAA